MKITNRCFGIFGLGCVPPWVVNSGFIVGDKKTLVVDTGANRLAAETIYGYASNIRPDNQIIVINTEKHLDHISGNAYFAEKGCNIYGHAGINRNNTDLLPDIEEYHNSIPNRKRQELDEEKIFYNNTTIVNPAIKITEETTVDLGGVKAFVLLTSGHTLTNISVYMPDEKVLYCGDCIVNKYMPTLECGGIPEWKLWIESLEKIKSLEPDYIVPGHGELLTGENINNEINRITGIIYKAIESGYPPTL